MVAVDFNGGKTIPYTYSTVNNTASLNTTTNFNLVGASGFVQGVKCLDVLKGDTAHSLMTCVPLEAFPIKDDGTLTTQAYVVPTRNSTGDMQLTPAGQGVGVKSPDGSHCGRIGLDNTGAVAVTSVTCW